MSRCIWRGPAFHFASAMASRFSPKPGHGEVGLWPLVFAGAKHCKGTRTWACLYLLSHLGAMRWTLSSSQSSFPRGHVMPLHTLLAHGPTPFLGHICWDSLCFFLCIWNTRQPCKPWDTILYSTLPESPVGLACFMIHFTFRFLGIHCHTPDRVIQTNRGQSHLVFI